MYRKLMLVMLSALVVLPSAAVSAQTSPLSQGKEDSKLIAAVKKLSSSSITKRLEAKRELKASGKQAIPFLKKAALSGKREQISHSIDLLGDFYQQTADQDLRDSAEKALKDLSQSKLSSVAQRAKGALDSKKGSGIQAFPGWNKPGAEFNGQNMMGGGESVSVSSTNGMKTITIKSGGNTMVLTDMPGGRIHVQNTAGGKTTEFIAKNLKDLKKKNQEAFDRYSRYGKGGMGRAGFAGFPQLGNVARAQAFQQMGNMPNGLFNGMRQQRNDSNAEVIRHLQQIKRQLKGNRQAIEVIDQKIRKLKRSGI